MAIIVDKVQKRKDIALSCKELFFQNGINDLTISQVAKTAGVGKGTIYEYFKNKEDIVSEIVNILLQEHNIKKREKIDKLSTTREKVKEFYSTFYNDNNKDIELRHLYKEFISITLVNPERDMVEFQTRCNVEYFGWFNEIIQTGIENKEIIKESNELVRGLFVAGEGMFISSSVTNSITNLKEEINSYIDAIFNLIEVKNV